MRSWTGIPELKQSYRTLGPKKFIPMMLGTFAWIGIGAWLTIAMDYPRSVGSTCRRKCLIEEYWYSGALLERGDPMSLCLFVYLWSMPALVIGAFAYAFVTKRGIFKKSDSE